MALKLRKDIKKSSYYVWFLGAKESKGLRGSEYILPVIKHLEEREKDVEPFKVTLQVSHKGLKIIQNIVSQGPKNSKPKNETIKHFIPHNTITYVHQHEDIIACILLLFNPVTKCPLHVHAYRCDSLETASHLKQQLQILIERPENQKKIAEIENRLKPVEKVKKLESSIGSDTGASTRESESSEERFALENSRISSLYNSVAAELREKLKKKNSPILLPPRDYDTVHRQKGNLTGIELRRCLNENVVGQNVKNKRLESSGGSSGIGSDHPPSPESPETPDSRFHTLETHSTSEDEDWNGAPADTTLYLMHGSHHQVSLPRPLNNHETNTSADHAQKFSRYAHEDLKFTKSFDDNYRKSTNNITKYLEKPISKFSDNKYLQRQKSIVRDRELKDDAKEKDRDKEVVRENFKKSLERNLLNKKENKYLEKSVVNNSERYFEEERTKNRYSGNERERNGKYNNEGKKNEKDKTVQYFEDDGFDENYRSRNNSTDFIDKHLPSRTFSYEEEVFFEEQRPFKDYQGPPAPRQQQQTVAKDEFTERSYGANKENKEIRFKSNPNDPRYYKQPSPQRTPRNSREMEKDYQRSNNEDFSFDSNRSRYYYEDTTNSINRRHHQYRQRSPSPEEVKAPRDRFKDAKEKFLLMEKERLKDERRRPEPPISPTIQKDKIHFIKRHQSMAYPSKDHLRNNYEDRYSNERREYSDDSRPKPTPRYIEEVRYRNNRERDGFRTTDKYDPKRRSMFSLIEEEHKKNSNEIAKELKRRSYIDFGHQSFEDQITDFTREEDTDFRNNRQYQELPEADRYNHPIVDNFSKSSHNLDKMADAKYDAKFIKNPQKILKNIPGYRHSYAEPKMKLESKKKNMSDMLHRTNSSVGYMQPRVGIASVHPY